MRARVWSCDEDRLDFSPQRATQLASLRSPSSRRVFTVPNGVPVR